jgi:hypothetical protein
MRFYESWVLLDFYIFINDLINNIYNLIGNICIWFLKDKIKRLMIIF